MAPRKKRATNNSTVTIQYKRRNTRRKLIDEEVEESTRFEKSTEEEVEKTDSKHSTDEEAHEIDVSSTNIEEENRGAEDEPNGTTIPEKETSTIAESFPIDPPLDSSFVKTISNADYNLESMIDRYPNLKGSVTIKSELDKEAFSAHPWGRISYDITIQHHLQSVKPSTNTTNLYGFPWAFMCWAFEVIPFLRKKFKVYPEQVSSPRIFRWLSATNDKSININELFNPSEDSMK